MEVNVNQVLKDFEDKEIKDVKGNVATLRSICIDVLMAQFDDERGLPGEEKVKRFDLALRIKYAHEQCTMTVEEVASLKKLIGKAYGPMVVGLTWKMLENAGKSYMEVIK